MKKTLLIITFAIALIGCNKQTTRKAGEGQLDPAQDNFIAEIKPAIPVSNDKNSHLCNAPTKTGGKCTRKVANKNGLTIYCFQHRGDN